MWYNLSVKSKIIKNCCYGYPNPKTHAYLKNHITFLTGKDGITISARNNTLSSSLLLSNKNKNVRNESQELKVINSQEMIKKKNNNNNMKNNDNNIDNNKKHHTITTNNNTNDNIKNNNDSFTFSTIKFSNTFLKCLNNKTILCHQNCSRSKQGTCFLEPTIKAGQYKEVMFRIDNKPGRMCYFFGICRASKLFNVDAGQSTIRQNSISLENLYGTLHNESASTNKSLPSFHTGSIIKLIIDRRKKDIVKFDVHIDSSGKTFHVDVKKMKKTDEIFVFTSLYNNKAKISII